MDGCQKVLRSPGAWHAEEAVRDRRTVGNGALLCRKLEGAVIRQKEEGILFLRT